MINFGNKKLLVVVEGLERMGGLNRHFVCLHQCHLPVKIMELVLPDHLITR